MAISVVDKLSKRQTFGSAAVQQAVHAAQRDAAERAKLAALVQQRPGDFEDREALNGVLAYLATCHSDGYEVVPNTHGSVVDVAEVYEARITKVEDKHQTIDITPPPPPPQSYRPDPLNVAGKAAANSVVEFYNASRPGRPPLGTATTDAEGNFSWELRTEALFKHGDQIGVRVVGRDETRSRPLIVPTEPFLITNLETTYVRRNPNAPNGVEVVRVDRTSTHRALPPDTDARKPFFQQDLVSRSLEIPGEAGDPYTLSLVGHDDAVEPNATITVKVGNQTYQTTVDDLGRFALKVRDVLPGQHLTLEVRDIHGNGIDIPARVPPVAMDAASIARGIASGEDGLDVRLKGLPPAGGLIVRSTVTGVVSELVADGDGRVKGTLDLAPFEPFEVSVRDVNGHIAETTELMVSVGKSTLRASELQWPEPDLASALRHMCGPPVDLKPKGTGVKDPRGPFLPLPELERLPPHGTLEVVRPGKQTQRFRADEHGHISGMIQDVRVNDPLTFVVRDVAGRRFPTEVIGYVVGTGAPKHEVKGWTPPALARLDPSKVGTGTLDLDPVWLTPARILVGEQRPKDFPGQHAVLSMAGGALLERPSPFLMNDYFPELNADQGASLTVTQRAGVKTLGITFPGTPGASFAFGVDDTLGTLAPQITAADLPRASQALKAALAFVAFAQAQGLEPGDAAYDRALGAAHTMLFLLDHVAKDPAHADAARKAAHDAFPAKGFPFQVTARDVVPPCGDDAMAVIGPSSSAVNLLQARGLALGSMSRAERGIDALDSLKAIDVAALGAQSSINEGVLTLDARGLVQPGHSFAVRIGEKAHVAVADPKGHAELRIEGVADGTVVEIAHRAPAPEGGPEWKRARSPIARAVVTSTGLLGEDVLVPLDSLVQRAPDLARVMDAVHAAVAKGGTLDGVKGLSPAGALVLVKDGEPLVTLRADEDGALSGKLNVKPGEILDVRVLDAAGRPFAPTLKSVVLGAAGTGNERMDVDAMSLRAVADAVGTGALALPRFPKVGPYGERAPSELSAELNPYHGHSSTLESSGGRLSTQAGFPPGLLPAAAAAAVAAKPRSGFSSMKLNTWQWEKGEVGFSSSMYLEGQSNEVTFTVDPAAGLVTSRATGKPVVVPDGLPALTAALQTSIAFVAVGQKLGSEPGDAFYDVAARAAKSALVALDMLIARHPTFRTEMLAAMRAALPPIMPFDLAPLGNARGTVQTAPADRQLASAQRFWNAVELAEFAQRPQWGYRAPSFDARVPVSRGPLWSIPATVSAYDVNAVAIPRRR